MKNNIGYALIKRSRFGNDSLETISHFLPIFWLKKVALKEAEKFNCRVVKVKIIEETA